MRKVIVLWVSTLLVLSAAVAFANGQKESTAMASSSGHKTLTVGFAQVGAESAWRTAETNSIKDTAKKEGINLKFVDAQQQQANQIAAIRSFIAEKVDGIILAPVVATGWDQILGEAKAAGIPVILVDRGINADPSLYTTVIVGDYVYQGKADAIYLAKAMDHKGNIVELEGTPGSSPQIDRKKGFADYIKQYPDMHIVYDQTGNFTRSGGLQVMEAAIKAVGASNINAVYAQNDDMALGAIQAMQAAGMQPGAPSSVSTSISTLPAISPPSRLPSSRWSQSPESWTSPRRFWSWMSQLRAWTRMRSRSSSRSFANSGRREWGSSSSLTLSIRSTP